MADVNFDCPHCGQNLDAPDDMAGMKIACPACSEALAIPGGIDEGGPGEESRKNTTMRIDLGHSVAPPPPQKRIVKIKRRP